MNIVLISDAGYMDMTMMCIHSIIQTKYPTTQIQFHILVTEGLDSELESKLQKFSIVDNVKVITYNLSSYLKDQGLDVIKTTTHVSTSALIKFFIPEILYDYNQCLYIDGDILVRKDLSGFYGYDKLQNKYATVVKDFGMLKVWRNDKDPFVKDNSYFCSGQMLMDLNKLREFKFATKCVDVKLNKYRNNWLMDQTVINYVLHNNVSYLGPEFCLSYHKMVLGVKGYDNIEWYNEVYGTKYSNIYQLILNSVLWHFHGNKSDQLKNSYLKQLHDDTRKAMLEFIAKN